MTHKSWGWYPYKEREICRPKGNTGEEVHMVLEAKCEVILP